MTDEIKEILEALKPHIGVKEYSLILSLEQQKILLDYITNLQNENDDLKNRLVDCVADNALLLYQINKLKKGGFDCACTS